MNVKEKIQAHKMTQWEVAEVMEISEFTLSRWLRRPDRLEIDKRDRIEEAIQKILDEREEVKEMLDDETDKAVFKLQKEAVENNFEKWKRKLTIEDFKRKMLIIPQPERCLVCPATDLCKNTDLEQCKDVIDKWAKEIWDHRYG